MMVTRDTVALGRTFIFAISFIGTINGITVDDGSVCSMEKVDALCPSGMNEIYTDIGHTKMCCEAETKAEKNQITKAVSCRPSKCISGAGSGDHGGFEDVCSSSKYLGHRVVNGRELEYENMIEGKCNGQDGEAENDKVALCCVKGSTDEHLVTTFGAESDEFPHMAIITTPGLCAATVYNKKFLITAAHCVVHNYDGSMKPVNGMTVTLATSSIADMGNEKHVYKVRQVIPHEGYSQLRGNPEREKGYVREFNDIALVELTRDIQFGDSVKALEIAPTGFKPEEYSHQAVVLGWGRQPQNFVWKHLQKSNFFIRNDSTCFDPLGGYWWTMGSNQDQLLCLGGILNKSWSPIVGRGDSGGPAVCRNGDGHPVLCGVVSFGPPHKRCLDNQDEKNCPPSIFVDVGYFHDWIVKNAGEQENWTLHKPYLYGRQVVKVSYEHQVHITSDSGNSCGGTLLAQDIVITAAHCIYQGDTTGSGEMHTGIIVTSANGNKFRVGAAEHVPDFKRVWPRRDVDTAEDIFANSDYHKLATDHYHSHDLALIKLTSKVNIDPVTIPRIPTENETFSSAKEVAYSRNTIGGGGNENLMDRNFKILGQNDCRKRLERLSEAGMRVRFHEGLLCGLEMYSGGSICDRELGGGLICHRGGESVLCGVQAFRFCERSYPNLFTDIAYPSNSKWIQERIEKWSAET